uniref:Ovule protein n=1 Tax=Strongyloides venezuelensis TaxID=75913 RepID=A0A0K0G597_STRVS
MELTLLNCECFPVSYTRIYCSHCIEFVHENFFKYSYHLTIDFNNSTKDSNMEEEHSKEQDDTLILSDEVIVTTLSKLS